VEVKTSVVVGLSSPFHVAGKFGVRQPPRSR
jgi:hypothetical protein